MTSKERLVATLGHKEPDKVAVDFGSTSVTGIHCRIVEKLREHYGLEKHPVKVHEPFQMLGMVEPDLQEAIGCDCEGVFGTGNMFGSTQMEYHLQKTHWGQEVLMSTGISLEPDAEGTAYVYPCDDRSCSPCAKMPDGCFFFNTIERQEEIDEDKLDPSDNLEEFGYITDEALEHFGKSVDAAALTGRGVVASFGGTALGDIALVPAMDLKHPKGIRSVAEWYMSTVIRTDYIKEVFERQMDIAIENYKKLWARCGSKVDVVFLCGTDFGTQDSQFCSVEAYRDLYLPYYRRMTDWIHSNTNWKVFKHCCGSATPLIPSFIDSGFDILNPVQINAKDMDPRMLKREFGKDIVFWGGGVDTQTILPFGTPEQVRKQVLEEIEILGKDGGFVFNTIHNVQANVPVENIVALVDTLREVRG